MGMTASSARGFMGYSEREERRTCAPRVYQFFHNSPSLDWTFLRFTSARFSCTSISATVLSREDRKSSAGDALRLLLLRLPRKGDSELELWGPDFFWLSEGAATVFEACRNYMHACESEGQWLKRKRKKSRRGKESKVAVVR